MSTQLQILFYSMLPVFEARYAIPLGILKFKMSIAETVFFASMGSIIATTLVLALLPVVEQIKFKPFKRIVEKIFAFTRKRHSKMFETIEDIGIIAFVAIPLPGTGVYTGSLICYLLGISFKRSLILNTIGMLISVLIMVAMTEGVLGISSIL